MCKFCYKLGDINKEIIWEVRSCMADQNISDFNETASEWDSKHRGIDSEAFSMTAYKDNGITSVSIAYRLETDDGIIISPFSNTIPWSFCPFCGEQISDSVKLAEDLYQHELDIDDDQEYELRDYK